MPGRVITQESVRAYVAALSALNARMTIVTRVQELYDATRVKAQDRP